MLVALLRVRVRLGHNRKEERFPVNLPPSSLPHEVGTIDSRQKNPNTVD